MIKIITAINNPKLNEELKKEKNLEIIGRDIQYKEGIIEILESKNYFLENNKIINYNNKINNNKIKNKKIINNIFIILNSNLDGEIKLNNLIENILEKNKKIKIIILIKKENKIKIKNKNIILLNYEKKINVKKIKEIILNEKINKIYSGKNLNSNNFLNSNKNQKKFIICGDRKVGKSLTIFNIIQELKDENKKILIVNWNAEFPYITEKSSYHNNIKSKKIKLKNIKKYKNKFTIVFIGNEVNKKFIINLEEKVDLISKYKFLNLTIKNIEKNYDYIFYEIYINKKNINKIQKKLKNNKNNILIIKPNLYEIKNNLKIINLNKKINYNILLNNYNKNSIDEKIIKNIFKNKKIIEKINYEENYEKIINSNFKLKNNLSKNNKNNFKMIVENYIK